MTNYLNYSSKNLWSKIRSPMSPLRHCPVTPASLPRLSLVTPPSLSRLSPVTPMSSPRHPPVTVQSFRYFISLWVIFRHFCPNGRYFKWDPMTCDLMTLWPAPSLIGCWLSKSDASSISYLVTCQIAIIIYVVRANMWLSMGIVMRFRLQLFGWS